MADETKIVMPNKSVILYTLFISIINFSITLTSTPVLEKKPILLRYYLQQLPLKNGHL
jgi:hypothetical protein